MNNHSTGGNNALFDKNCDLLINRISSFQTPFLNIGVWDMTNGHYSFFTIKNPADFRINLEDTDCYDHLYAFSKFFPEFSQKIYAAHINKPIKISLEAELSSGLSYQVLCLVTPEFGISNVVVDSRLRKECYYDDTCRRVFADFFLGAKGVA